mgnify:FL=1
MKIVARLDEDPPIVRIPDIVGIAVVAVEPETFVIVLDVEHVEVSARVGYV